MPHLAPPAELLEQPAFAATELPVEDAPAPRSQPPLGTQPRRILWPYAISIVSIHLLCLLALLPWFFSWTGVALAIGGHYVFGMLGMTLCYHRLLAHRGFTCSKWFEYSLATLGVCCLQDSPARWVAVSTVSRSAVPGSARMNGRPRS